MAVPAFVVRHSPIHGTGVFAARDIAANEEIIEYAGRRITQAQADAEYPEENGHTFLYVLNEHYLIDGGVDGNDARWINHSCDPNCEAVHVDGEKKKKDRIYIEALRDIKEGEELTYNYGIVLEEPHTAANKKLWACHCGSATCSGTMLQPKSKPKRKRKG